MRPQQAICKKNFLIVPLQITVYGSDGSVQMKAIEGRTTLANAKSEGEKETKKTGKFNWVGILLF